MADPVAVAGLKARAEDRLKTAVFGAAEQFGVPFNPVAVPNYERDLKSARFIEAVADFVERLTAKAQEKRS